MYAGERAERPPGSTPGTVIMNKESESSPTGLEWATIDEICRELSNRYESFVLLYAEDHKTDSDLISPHLRYKNTFAALGLLSLAPDMVMAGLMREDRDNA